MPLAYSNQLKRCLRLSPVRSELDHPVVCLEDRGEAFVSPPEGAEGAEGTDSSQPADLA